MLTLLPKSRPDRPTAPHLILGYPSKRGAAGPGFRHLIWFLAGLSRMIRLCATKVLPLTFWWCPFRHDVRG